MVTLAPIATHETAEREVNRGGRPPTFDRPLKLAIICARMEEGTPLEEICREEGMPATRTVREWRENFPEVAAAIARAADAGHDALAVECLRIADDPSLTDKLAVMRAKLRIETRMKLLACWSKRYNPQADHTTNVNVGVQVTGLTDTERETLMAKKQRVIAARKADSQR